MGGHDKSDFLYAIALGTDFFARIVEYGIPQLNSVHCQSTAEDRNMDARFNTADDPSTSDKN